MIWQNSYIFEWYLILCHYLNLYALYQFHFQTLPITKIDRIQFREYVSTGTEPIVIAALLIKVQCLGKIYTTKIKTYRPLGDHWVILAMLKAFNYGIFFNPTGRNSLRIWPSLVWKLDHRRRLDEIFLQKQILKTIFHKISIKAQSMTWRTFQMSFEAYDICNPV